MTYEVEPIPPEPEPPAELVEGDRPCLQCGYSLARLPVGGNCPECGTPIANSLRGNLLEFAAPAYLEALQRGTELVIAGAAATVLARLGGLVLAVVVLAVSGAKPPRVPMELVGGIIELLASVIGLLGWWLLSSPDPGLMGADTSVNARKVVRVAVAIGAVSALCGFGLVLIPIASTAAINLGVAEMVVGLAGSAAWVVQFFASMQYLRWLARRIPSRSLYDDAGRFMWLGPLLYVLLYICLGLGPLIALGLYVLILLNLRSEIVGIRREAATALTTGPAAPPAGGLPTPSDP